MKCLLQGVASGYHRRRRRRCHHRHRRRRSLRRVGFKKYQLTPLEIPKRRT